ncbi:MAG: hypothetical protein KatS3mg105_5146 [Gemmatales bacterium]|nr:MAG: hypothetical protein KatS3mg105_5146 [Gemmatales bacterium]GIW97843.1 MAG: hypothetical protein KatS3mg111_1176 [Pirellulaceae bacterium]
MSFLVRCGRAATEITVLGRLEALPGPIRLIGRKRQVLDPTRILALRDAYRETGNEAWNLVRLTRLR